MKNQPRHLARAFTLVELIVVVGVIAILVGLLLPVLTTARATARAIQCASNLRQIGMTCIAYVTEWRGVLPNNSYTIADDPTTMNPLPPSGTQCAQYNVNHPSYRSTANYQWFDAVAAWNGWRGQRTCAARYGAGEQDIFRQVTQYLWCPDIDQSIRDSSIFTTGYAIPRYVSEAYPLYPAIDTWDFSDGGYDFLAYSKFHRGSQIVFLLEANFNNSSATPYMANNSSLANVNSLLLTKPTVAHRGLNYLFLDGHVSRERVPPHSMALSGIGTFSTIDGDRYTITSSADQDFRLALKQP